MIIDAHCHIFRKLRGRLGRGAVKDAGNGQVCLEDGTLIYVMPTTESHLKFTSEDLLAMLDRAHVERAVLLQGPFYGEANQDVAEAVFRHPSRFRGAAYLDPWEGDDLAVYHQLTRDLGLSCIKLELSHDFGLMGLHPQLDVGAGELEWLWGACEHDGIVLTLDPGPPDGPAYQVEAIERIATEFPSLRIVIPHLGNPRQTAQDDAKFIARWNQLLAVVGRRKNMAMDLAALPHRCSEGYPWKIVGRWIEHAIERIGASHLMWGSDIPGLLNLGSYEMLVETSLGHLSKICPADREMILCGTALEFYWASVG